MERVPTMGGAATWTRLFAATHSAGRDERFRRPCGPLGRPGRRSTAPGPFPSSRGRARARAKEG